MLPINAAQNSTVTTKPTATPVTPAKVIREAEKALKLAGFNPGKVDGKATPAFTAALTTFQKAWGLPETGVVDAATLSKLRHTEKRIHNHDGKGDKFASIGEKSGRIEEIEKKLRALGYDPGKVDGIYDRETAEAVKAFKRDQPELKNTHGYIGNPGQAALAREVKALQHGPERRRIKPTKAQLRLDVKTAKAAAQGLQEGSRGAAVKNIQKHLKAAGFDPQHTNGVFDERTAAALKAFQRRSGLEPTGEVNGKTWKELKKSYILAKGAASPAQARGERSGAVRSTEKLLKSLGYKVKVDGFFDARTERAVKAFEKKHHLNRDGKVTTGELAKIKKAEKASHGLHVTNAMRRLARAGKSVALSMGGYSGTGYCATGVSRAIARALGLSVHGNGNQIDNNLPRSHFKQIHIPLSKALKIPGLILTWEHTSSALGQKYGHTAITLGNGRSSASDFVEFNTLAAQGGRSGLKIFIPV
jgi:peptidoglycan hydrolase-like protein with peptidoglycan-binding domain